MLKKTTPEQLHKRLDDLMKTIDDGDWKEEQEAMNAEKQRLVGCKRKLDERLDEEFLEERQRLREGESYKKNQKNFKKKKKPLNEEDDRRTAVVAVTVNDIIVIENDN
jgi:hypothetical protein